jgi:arginase family enzyme
VHLDLDQAWQPDILGLPRRDARAWGPKLRCFAPRADMEAFIRDVVRELPPFVLYGSGDFHHLTAAFLREVRSPALNLVSFDNHPDWDVRPPHWACGGWMKRALELPTMRRASVWGCGNFELKWPARLFGLRDRRLEVHGWAERYGDGPESMARNDWRSQFETFAQSLGGQDVYVTVDLDCLRQEELVANWENGLFTADDVAWAIRALRSQTNVVGGDICGAYSPPIYARRLQQFAAEWDRPKLPPRDPAINLASLQTIWPALIGERVRNELGPP